MCYNTYFDPEYNSNTDLIIFLLNDREVMNIDILEYLVLILNYNIHVNFRQHCELQPVIRIKSNQDAIVEMWTSKKRFKYICVHCDVIIIDERTKSV